MSCLRRSRLLSNQSCVLRQRIDDSYRPITQPAIFGQYGAHPALRHHQVVLNQQLARHKGGFRPRESLPGEVT